jgi:hypothetical protein
VIFKQEKKATEENSSSSTAKAGLGVMQGIDQGVPDAKDTNDRDCPPMKKRTVEGNS